MTTRIVVEGQIIALNPLYDALAELDPHGAFSSRNQTRRNREVDSRLAEIGYIVETGVVPDHD